MLQPFVFGSCDQKKSVMTGDSEREGSDDGSLRRTCMVQAWPLMVQQSVEAP